MRETNEKESAALSKIYLSDEVSYLYHSLFKSSIPDALKTKYIRAHEFIIPSGTVEQVKAIKKIIKFNLDVEAVELAFRKKDLQHPLLQKIKILIYLMECDSKYYHLFINERASFLEAIFALLYHSFYTSYKLIKGKILKWRYNLV